MGTVGFSLGGGEVKQLEHEVDHSPPYNLEEQNTVYQDFLHTSSQSWYFTIDVICPWHPLSRKLREPYNRCTWWQ
jgi:hypothetical protein